MEMVGQTGCSTGQSDPLWSEPGSYSSTKTGEGKAFGFESRGI